jgi:hypothetical protein
MKTALAASRLQSVVMHATAAPKHSKAAFGARHRRHNAGHQRARKAVAGI